MSRIELADTGFQTIMKMSEGNPGAVTALCEIAKSGATIDPDSAFGGIGAILSLDTLGIYGSRIWMLYSDVCKNNVVKTIAVLRATQLGLLDESKLNIAIENYGEGLDVDSILAQVRKELPNFAKVGTTKDEGVRIDQ